MLLRSVTVGVLIFSALGICGCGGSANGPARIDITGQWTLDLTYANTQHGVSCSSKAVMVGFTQVDTAFTGTALSGTQVCSSQTTSTTTSLVGQAWTGQINGALLTSRVGSCSVSANVSGDPANAMSGIITCSLAVTGGQADLAGMWSGRKQ